QGGPPLDVVAIDGVGDFVFLSDDGDGGGERLLDDALADPLVELGEDRGPFEGDALRLGRIRHGRGKLREQDVGRGAVVDVERVGGDDAGDALQLAEHGYFLSRST